MLRGARCRSCLSAGTAPRNSPCAPSRTRLPCKPARSTSSTRSASSLRCPPCTCGRALGRARVPAAPDPCPRAGPAARLPGGVPGKRPVSVRCARALQVLEKGEDGEDTPSPLPPLALPGCPSPVHRGHRVVLGVQLVQLWFPTQHGGSGPAAATLPPPPRCSGTEPLLGWETRPWHSVPG